MSYVALTRLRFGDAWIDPGEPVPVEDGRNYQLMLESGEIRHDHDPESEETPRAAWPAWGPDPEPEVQPEDETEPEPAANADGDPGAPPSYAGVERAELLAMLTERGVEVPPGPVQDEALIALLSAGDAAKAEREAAEGDGDGTSGDGSGDAPPADTVDYTTLKQPELKAELGKRGIEYKAGPISNKDLVALLEADDAAKADEDS